VTPRRAASAARRRFESALRASKATWTAEDGIVRRRIDREDRIRGTRFVPFAGPSRRLEVCRSDEPSERELSSVLPEIANARGEPALHPAVVIARRESCAKGG